MSMSEKEARKLIKKLEKKRARKARKKREAKYGIPMYKDAGCHKCNRGQLYSGGGCELSITYYSRCKCANIYSKQYKKFLKKKPNMRVSKAKKEKTKFYDNNSHIDVGNNATDRSW